jgi:hypothetical protein
MRNPSKKLPDASWRPLVYPSMPVAIRLAHTYERRKRNRSLLLPAVLCAIALMACTTSTSQRIRTTRGPGASGVTLESGAQIIHSEQSVQVGDVSAVYLSVAPRVPRWKLYAITQSGERIEPLVLLDAIARAGGNSKLASELPQLPIDEQLLSLIPGTQPFKEAHCQNPAECLFWTAGSLTTVLAWPIAWGASRDSFHRLYYGTFPGVGLTKDDPAPMKGYAFFPRGSYIALEYVLWRSYDPFNPTSGAEIATSPWR